MNTKTAGHISLALIACAHAASIIAPANAGQDIFLDTIVVTGQRDTTDTTHQLHAEDMPPISADTAAMISRLPGAALNSNGSLSGQVQYRGATGFRVGSKINHQGFHSGGPNLMDPPMHYAPPALVDTIEVYRGTADLSFGPSLIGGVNTQLKSVAYAPGSEFESDYDLTAIGRTADDSHALGGVFGLANDQLKAFGFFSAEQGGNKTIPDGEIANTHHERDVYGISLGFKQGDSQWELEARRQDTGPTGNPPFAMDIDYVETDFYRLAYAVAVANTDIRASVSYVDVDHGMSNFAHRPPPPQTMRYRYTRATADTLAFSLDFSTQVADRTFNYGADTNKNQMHVNISNPRVPAFFVTPLPDITIKRTGLYANMEQPIGKGFGSIGARIDQHDNQAGKAVTGPMVPAMVGMLANQFNAANRQWKDTTTDLLARYWVTTDAGTWRASLARKNRAPTYLERYGWLPIAASAGLADGNNYVGDLALEPETATIAELGVDLSRGSWWVRPTVFYHSVNQYIQGVAFDTTPGTINNPVEMISGMNGDPTPLRFANVDARMFGVDADFGYQLSAGWRLDGVVSVVRGERRDVDDNLYRISPNKLTLDLIYERANWSVTLEGVAVAAQSRVSVTNSELATSGYGVLNLHGSWRVNDQVFVSAGLENLADRTYVDHLAGYNRVRNSDVGLGERLPGVGRSAYLRVSLTR